MGTRNKRGLTRDDGAEVERHLVGSECPAVVAWREQMLARTRQAPVPNRVAYLRGLAAGRKVLDIGVVEHDVSNEQSDRWLHRHLVEASAECLGVDVLAEGIEALRAKGYNVQLRDVTSEPLDDRFD